MKSGNVRLRKTYCTYNRHVPFSSIWAGRPGLGLRGECCQPPGIDFRLSQSIFHNLKFNILSDKALNLPTVCNLHFLQYGAKYQADQHPLHFRGQFTADKSSENYFSNRDTSSYAEINMA